jgi:hypothetical protein
MNDAIPTHPTAGPVAGVTADGATAAVAAAAVESLAVAPPAAPRPLPRVPIAVRPGTPDDLPFIDALQKRHAAAVGWMPTATLAGKIKLGHVLIAEDVRSQWSVVSSEGSRPATDHGPLTTDSRVGYCIAADQYFKRDDVGVVYQMNVVPGRQRGLVGAALLQAQFDRSAYGCKLYCCWCAQDLAANRFWEAMGFVPLAYRVGSERKGPGGSPRVHVFWQKRIRPGDTGDPARGGTPWWFPSKTAGGSLRADRIVLPIPPGAHWADAKPLVLPAAGVPDAGVVGVAAEAKALPTPKRAAATKAKAKADDVPPPVRRNGLMFDIPQPGEPLPEATAAATKGANKSTAATAARESRPKPERVKRVCDPRLASAARELRDRWLERVNADPALLVPAGKYDVAKAVGHVGEPAIKLLPPTRLLPAA